ncbi:cytochrome b/b6 domain-containing protein [Rhodoferax sp.]|uniref:cytochrome b/b6 domain-containing protein n=1 Tax=Rhodoferax sp. TaxID=50421 RepID=UPI002851D899|nr:cytochrome b/b6 domain-containing protein [Rhodoferax sp.]MDR3369300.1 cytochrome b/b6 domain-containing protein [Rhodoferax sp.]
MAYVIRVWDAPTRIFHWVLAGCVVALLITAQVGGAAMEWHFWLGYTVLVLLMFRFFWGLVGGHWSRFTSFLFSPGQVLRYVRGKSEMEHWVGHNPAGALSVFALLGFLTLQVISGLFSDDEISATGPLTRFVSSTWVSNATYYHKEIGKLILIALVALHVSAIVFYFFKKHENLVRAMITGNKHLALPAEESADKLADRTKAAAILLVCAAMIWGVVRWIG